MFCELTVPMMTRVAQTLQGPWSAEFWRRILGVGRSPLLGLRREARLGASRRWGHRLGKKPITSFPYRNKGKPTKILPKLVLYAFCARFWCLHQGWCEALRHSGDLRSRTQRGPKQSSRKALIRCKAQESLQEKLVKKFFHQIVVFHGLHWKCLARMWY